jgi:mono/diheme cytochrome c family protein
MPRLRPLARTVSAGACLALLGACRQDMHDAPRYEAYEKSAFFADQRAMRPQVEGTVARGQLRDNLALHTGKNGATFLATFPVPLDETMIRRGQQRFQIYCMPCHGLLGKGDGMIVRRGYRQPPSLHLDRLRQQPAGYFFDVMTNGFGVMPDYAAQITVEDRWAVAAYIRALQISQNATIADVPTERRAELDAPIAEAPGGGPHK